MRNFVVRLVVNALALSVAAYIVPGIRLTGGAWSLLLVAFVFGLVNAILKPILMILSLPFILLTLGLFAFVVNALLLWITAGLTEHLAVNGLGPALLGSIVISLVTMFMGGVLSDDPDRGRG